MKAPEKISDLYEYFDTIILNPPFGTSNNEDIDVKLLSCCINVSTNFNINADKINLFLGLEERWISVFYP